MPTRRPKISISSIGVLAVLASTAWADPRFLLIVPLAGAGFWFYRRHYRDEPAADDPDWDL